MNPFESYPYQPGVLYSSDDDTTLIHVYFTPDISEASADVPTRKEYPVLVANTADIKVGSSELSLKNAFVTLWIMSNGGEKEASSSLFLKSLEGAVVEQVDPTAAAPDINRFYVRVRGKDNEQIGSFLWELATATADNTGGEPSISTRLQNDKFGNNTTYKATGQRPTAYLTDRENNVSYKLHLSKFLAVEDGIHTEPTPPAD